MKKVLFLLLLASVSAFSQVRGRQKKFRPISPYSTEANVLELFILFPDLDLAVKDSINEIYKAREDEYFEASLDSTTTDEQKSTIYQTY